MSSITSFFSSFVSTVYADSPAEKPEEKAEEQQPEAEPEAEAAAEEEEPEEPVDVLDDIREECKTGKCAALAKHFEHCQEKVSSGEGFKGEDCVEELMMHCVDQCTAPKLFSKLR